LSIQMAVSPLQTASLTIPPREFLMGVLRWYYAAPVSCAAEPFYCDPRRVGAFAVEPGKLASGGDDALFSLFVCLSMYQALRDVVIMNGQRALTPELAASVADLASVGRSATHHDCPALRSAEALEQTCDVSKAGGSVDCGTQPGSACPVKSATRVFNRMGDMGKLPSSAWLRVWESGLDSVLDTVCREEPCPKKRAERLVALFATICRVGRKISTLFVSALSTPALAPGRTPWFPRIDGNHLVVVDTNVARVVDRLRPVGSPRTYGAREAWLREQAAAINLTEFRQELPRYSPRLLQEAIYAFGSKSNRRNAGDACADRDTPCARCVPALCPFPTAPIWDAALPSDAVGHPGPKLL